MMRMLLLLIASTLVFASDNTGKQFDEAEAKKKLQEFKKQWNELFPKYHSWHLNAVWAMMVDDENERICPCDRLDIKKKLDNYLTKTNGDDSTPEYKNLLFAVFSSNFQVKVNSGYESLPRYVNDYDTERITARCEYEIMRNLVHDAKARAAMKDAEAARNELAQESKDGDDVKFGVSKSTGKGKSGQSGPNESVEAVINAGIVKSGASKVCLSMVAAIVVVVFLMN